MRAGSPASALGSSRVFNGSAAQEQLGGACQGMLAPVSRSVIRGGNSPLVALDHQPRGAVRQSGFDSFLRPLGMDGDIDSSGEQGRED